MLECQCAKCKQACVETPGLFHPHQIKPLANALGISPQELFENHLNVGYVTTLEGNKVYYLRPAGSTALAGEVDVGAGGQCHWFVGGKCDVHRLGKPEACTFTMHYTQRDVRRRHMFNLLVAWAHHQDMIKEFQSHANG